MLAIASLGAAMGFIDATIVNIAFPDILRSFPGTSVATLSWVLNAYNIVIASFLVAAGRIADLLGRRRVFIIGLEVFTFASLLCALAPSPGILIGFRVLQALGAAFLVPSSLALVLQAFPSDRRSHGVALLSAVSALAAGIGPALGGFLVAADNWRLVFLVNIPVGIAVVLLARRHLVESRTPGRRRMPDLIGSLVFAAGIGTLVLAVVQGHAWGWGSAAIISLFVLSLVLLALFVNRCRWHRAPSIDVALLRIRTFSVANGMGVIAAAGFYGYTLTNVLFLTGVWHYSVLKAGLSMTPGPFVAAAVAGPTSRLVERVGHRPVLVAGGLIWGGAILWLVERVGVRPDFVGEWLPGIIFLGVGAGTLFPNISSAATASAPEGSFGTATGISSVARQAGAALGVAIVVTILGTPTPLTAHAAFQHAWSFGAVCMFVAGLGCLFVGRVEPGRSPALMASARLVLTTEERTPVKPAPPPRARRAVRVRDRPQDAPRAETAADFLGQVPLFAALDHEVRAAVAEGARSVRIEAGQWLFRQGEPGGSMFIVRAGRLEVIAEPSGTVIRELGRGDFVGELALITGFPRSASLRAARTSDLLEVGRSQFRTLLGSSHTMSLELNRVLGEQLASVHASAQAARPRPVTVALVALDPSVPAADLSRRLCEALQPHVHAERLDGAEVPPPAEGVEPAVTYAPLLDRAEATHDVVLLSAGVAGSINPWTVFCLQQADRILAVGRQGPLPGQQREWPDLVGCDLVAYDAPPGSGRLGQWAERLDPIETHVLRPDNLNEDLARIARRLTGQSIGVVLSGGGARAFSHIGVLQELVAAGIVIDRVAGVSMGAFIGGLFAMGLDPDEIDARCFAEWVQRRPLSDYTVPRHALIRGDRAEAMLRRTFGSVSIEELPRAFLCAYADLRTGRLLVARSGPMPENVGYSMCLPILAAPRVRGRQLLVDGSLVDNLPIGPMAELAEGPIIAVDVRAQFEPSGKPAQARADNGRPERLPSLGETLTRVLLLASSNTSLSAREHADLIIRPKAEGVGLLEFHQLDAAREAGRVAAQEALAQAPASLLG